MTVCELVDEMLVEGERGEGGAHADAQVGKRTGTWMARNYRHSSHILPHRISCTALFGAASSGQPRPHQPAGTANDSCRRMRDPVKAVLHAVTSLRPPLPGMGRACAASAVRKARAASCSHGGRHSSILVAQGDGREDSNDA